MKALKPVIKKRSVKQSREKKILLGLIEHFIKDGKPVGSNTLKEAGFDELSSATIRNYFANLEDEGFLTQHHSSGGRIPTDKAYRFYAHEFIDDDDVLHTQGSEFARLRDIETKEIAAFLQEAAEDLSHKSKCAIFLSAPRFDHDYIVDLKIVPIDSFRCLCVIITDFGVIRTEIIPLEKKLTSLMARKLESYFYWRLTGTAKPENLTSDEEALGKQIYNELMVRYIVGYSNFIEEEVYRTGFSKLLNTMEFNNPMTLATSLALFENSHSMRLLLKECSKLNRMKIWLGSDLSAYATEKPDCAVLAIPYRINQQPVGAVGLLGPKRMPYRQLFAMLRSFSECISTALTRNIYKFKISFRQPQLGKPHFVTGDSTLMLLEDKR